MWKSKFTIQDGISFVGSRLGVASERPTFSEPWQRYWPPGSTSHKDTIEWIDRVKVTGYVGTPSWPEVIGAWHTAYEGNYGLDEAARRRIDKMSKSEAKIEIDNTIPYLNGTILNFMADMRNEAFVWDEATSRWNSNASFGNDRIGTLGWHQGIRDRCQKVIDGATPGPDPPKPGPVDPEKPAPEPGKTARDSAHDWFHASLNKVTGGGDISKWMDRTDVDQWLSSTANSAEAKVQKWMNATPRTAETIYYWQYFSQISLEVQEIRRKIKSRKDRDASDAERESKFWAENKWYILIGAGAILVVGVIGIDVVASGL